MCFSIGHLHQGAAGKHTQFALVKIVLMPMYSPCNKTVKSLLPQELLILMIHAQEDFAISRED